MSSSRSAFASRAFFTGVTVAALVLVGSTRHMLLAQTATARASAPPGIDMSGLWLAQDPGSGDWSSWFDNVPPPALRPEIIADNKKIQANLDAGNVVNTAPRTPDCPAGGSIPMQMASSPPLNILMSREEVWVGSESGRGRVIYTDGRPHPDTKSPAWVPVSNGHSIGHWEADVLVVDTIGFPARVCDSRFPVMRTPRMGRVKDTTRLTERFRVTDNNRALAVTFTWEDPTVFLKPHTYTLNYRKVESGEPIEGQGN
jgi:hypothetical protein